MRHATVLIAGAVLLAGSASARTLSVGEGRVYKLPSEAFAAARDGDLISIAPGEYFDCSIVWANNLVIQGEGDGSPATLTDKVCEGKALLVLRGNNITVRNLTLQRARVPDGNGAGIRLESPNLTVDRVNFLNDQVGILSGAGGGTVTVTDSGFMRGGVGGERPKYALMIGPSARLRVSGCTFTDVKGGQIATEAAWSEITGNQIGVGTGDQEEYPANAVLGTAGAMTIERNVITVGPMVPRTGAVLGAWDDATVTLRQNRLINTTGQPIALLKDWTWGDPVLQDNVIGPADMLVSSSGIWRHRASRQYYARKEDARALASQAKQFAKWVLGR